VLEGLLDLNPVTRFSAEMAMTCDFFREIHSKINNKEQKT